MREIIFRGKRVDNLEWLFGNIQVPKPPFDKYFMNEDNGRQREVIPESVGQFTGLTDKNGNKIFEGDIINENGYVIWHLDDCSFSIDWDNSNLLESIHKVDCKYFEITGNIHDN